MFLSNFYAPPPRFLPFCCLRGCSCTQHPPSCDRWWNCYFAQPLEENVSACPPTPPPPAIGDGIVIALSLWDSNYSNDSKLYTHVTPSDRVLEITILKYIYKYIVFKCFEQIHLEKSESEIYIKYIQSCKIHKIQKVALNNIFKIYEGEKYKNMMRIRIKAPAVNIKWKLSKNIKIVYTKQTSQRYPKTILTIDLNYSIIQKRSIMIWQYFDNFRRVQRLVVLNNCSILKVLGLFVK